MSCELGQRQEKYRVEIYVRTLDTVDLVGGTAAHLDLFANEAVSLQLLDCIAPLPYTGAQLERARAWVNQTMPALRQNGDVRSASFGRVKYESYGLPIARNLDVRT